MRSEDVAARLGGDEFDVLLAHSDAASVVAERLHAALNPLAVPWPDAPASLGASIGLAVHHLGQSATALLSEADEAAYRAKRAGGGRVAVVDP